jgi:transposase
MRDWKRYNEGLVRRGQILIALDNIFEWEAELSKMNHNKEGRPYEYPESLIGLLQWLKTMFDLDYRSMEGVARGLIQFLKKAHLFKRRSWKAPDYTTLQKRFEKKRLKLVVIDQQEGQEIALDSSGLKPTNRGEYRLKTHSKRGFIKLHLAVNIKTHQIVDLEITTEKVNDSQRGYELVSGASFSGRVSKVYADGAYDTYKFHEEMKRKGIEAVIPPRYNAISKYPCTRSSVVQEYKKDPDRWKRQKGYGKRWMVETGFSRFKTFFGESVYSKKWENIKKEVILKATMLNLFMSLQDYN